MVLGITGFKCGMSRYFTEEGDVIPVTLVHVPKNYITQIKTKDKEGYAAIQLSCGFAKDKHLTLAQLGHLKASQIKSRELHEYIGSTTRSIGHFYSVADLEDVAWVDVQATSRGKGFTGVIRRWGFASQDATHGNSRAHRAHGSTGGGQDPGRVIKGKKMAGHLGNKTITVQCLKLLKIDCNDEILAIKGSIPGPRGAVIKIRPSIKKV
jgi:large subunit ribosomal protein L3